METSRESSPPPAPVAPLQRAAQKQLGARVRLLARGLFVLAIVAVTAVVLTFGIALLTADVY